MPQLIPGAISAGYLNFINNSLDRKRKEMELARFGAGNVEMERQRRAKQLFSRALVQNPEMFGQTNVPQMAMLPQAPGPGQSSVPAAGATPPGGTPFSSSIPPYLSYEDHVKNAPQPASEVAPLAADVSALPAAPLKAAARPAPQRQDIGAMVQTLKKLGYTDQEVLGVLEERRAFLAPENKAEIDLLKAETGVAVQTFRAENMAIKNQLDQIKERDLERHRKVTEGTATSRAQTYKDSVAQRRTATDAIQKRFEKRIKTAEQGQMKNRVDLMLKETQSIERAMDEVSRAVMAGYDVETNGVRLEALRKLWGEKMDAVNDAQGDLEDAIFEQRMSGHGTGGSAEVSKVPTAAGKGTKPKAPVGGGGWSATPR